MADRRSKLGITDGTDLRGQAIVIARRVAECRSKLVPTGGTDLRIDAVGRSTGGVAERRPLEGVRRACRAAGAAVIVICGRDTVGRRFEIGGIRNLTVKHMGTADRIGAKVNLLLKKSGISLAHQPERSRDRDLGKGNRLLDTQGDSEDRPTRESHGIGIQKDTARVIVEVFHRSSRE